MPWANFCAEDGSGAPCPCGNAGGADQGCANGTGAEASFVGKGSNSVLAGDLVLTAQGVGPGQFGMFFQGTTRVNGGAGAPFGDGLRCAGGVTRRLQTVAASPAGALSTTVDVALAGMVAPGDIRSYQIWYRDPLASLCGNGFNLSIGLGTSWVP